jgi:hypothetical protein
MHDDLDEKLIARRLRARADGSQDHAPYGWAEFKRRRDARAVAAWPTGRIRPALFAIAAAAAVLVAGIAIATLSHYRAPMLAPSRTVAKVDAGADAGHNSNRPAAADRLARQRTRALEGWLADLPHNPTVVRVGAHAAVTRLQDQIAALDDLMSAERAAGSQPARLDALEHQRAQLVSSLAQVQYAEMLASAAL